MSIKEQLLVSAKKLLDKGAVDKAIAEYRRAADADPKDTRTWLRIAELEVKRGRRAEATQTYLKTAELYTEQGFFQRAVAVYKNVLKLSPGLVEAHFKLADLFRQLGLLSDAMQQYEAAAAVYQRDGRVAEALDAMRRIVDLNPDHVMSRIKLAEAASQAGKKDEAIAEFQRAAEHLKLVGKIDEYLRVGERLVAHQPDNLELARELAAAYIERGNARFALAKLQTCFCANPRDVQTLTLLARAFEQLGQVGKTVSVLKELAHIHREEGREEEALATFRRIAAVDPSEVEARNELARASAASPRIPAPVPPRPATITFSEMQVPQFLLPRTSTQEISTPGRPESFAGAGRAPMASSGNDAEIQRIISECDVFVKYALLERAADHLQRVFQIDPSHVGARERLAYVLLQLGRNSEAATQFAMLAEQFRQSDPKRSAEYAGHAAAVRPSTREKHEPGTQPGSVPVFLAEADDSAEVLDVDELGAEYIPDPISDGEGKDLIALVDEVQPAAPTRVRTASKDDWAPPTFAEMALPDFAEFEAMGAEGDATTEKILVADLERVDAFLDAGLVQEARALLEDLFGRAAGDARVLARHQRLLSLSGAVPSAPAPRLESVPEPIPGGGPRAIGVDGGAPDARSAADPGLAYKDMGLYDAAIKEFQRVAREPGREVYALTMIGECFEAKGALADAVMQYKKALNRPGITEAETTQLYYALGKAFEALADVREALYFFEKVVRRDPEVFDVRERIARLKRGAGQAR